MKLEGFEDLSRKLNNLPDRTANRVLQKAVNKGLQASAKSIRRAAPSGAEPSTASAKYGKLKRNIRVKRLRPQSRWERAAVVHTAKAFWGAILEKGSRYVPANPWFKPAFDKSENEMLDAMGKAIGDYIEKEARK